MDKQAIISELTAEGWQQVQEVKFPENQIIEEHTHPEETIHILISGGMYLMEGERKDTLEIGKRYHIPAGTKHHGMVGPEGCSFIVGFKLF